MLRLESFEVDFNNMPLNRVSQCLMWNEILKVEDILTYNINCNLSWDKITLCRYLGDRARPFFNRPPIPGPGYQAASVSLA